jgi:cytochrome c556
MKTSIRLSTAVLVASLAVPAMAQFQKPEDAIKYRKAALSVMGTHFSRIGAMANGRVPFDAAVAAENAAVVEALSKLPFTAFGPGTDKGDTRALPAIWSEQAAFRQAADKMQAEVSKLAAAAKTGNLESVKATFGTAAQSCKACHDNYRKD